MSPAVRQGFRLRVSVAPAEAAEWPQEPDEAPRLQAIGPQSPGFRIREEVRLGMPLITSHPVPGLAESWVLLIFATIGLAVLLVGHRRRGPSLRAGLPDVLPWTGEVVDADRLAGAVQVRAATLKLRIAHANSRECRQPANTVDGYG